MMSAKNRLERIKEDLGIAVARTVKGAVAGFVGGVVASWMAHRFGETGGAGQSPDYYARVARERASGRRKSIEDRHESSVAVADAKHEKHEVAAAAKQYWRGGAAGALYGSVTELVPVAGMGMAVTYATALFLADREHTKPQPVDAPSRASVLGSHIVYGVSMDITRRIIRRML